MPYDYSDFRILHGEDDATDARVMQKVLQEFGYNGNYHNVCIGQDIVDQLLNKSNPLPGLILLDISLPGMTGLEILTVLRKEKRTIAVPILMLSGSSSLRDLHDCISNGANGYIKKTADREYFSNACQGLIEGWARLSTQTFF